jgi:hypothetical protein
MHSLSLKFKCTQQDRWLSVTLIDWIELWAMSTTVVLSSNEILSLSLPNSMEETSSSGRGLPRIAESVSV